MHTIAAVIVLALSSQTVPNTDLPDEPIRLFFPDGQLISNDLRVFVTTDISADNAPQLLLLGASRQPFERVGMARHQEWVHELGGQRVSARGTLLLFDVGGLSIPFYRARVRVTPMLRWTVPTGANTSSAATAIAPEPVNIGHGLGAVLWTILIIAALLAVIVLLAGSVKGKIAVDLVRAADGLLSLSRTQVAAWTVAVGAMVLAFGLMRVTLPDIPESLIVLMGLSLTTGGVSYALTRPSDQTPEGRRPWSWGDLVRGPDRDGKPMVSVARAQMLFWTVITLVIFLVKSSGEGLLWPVPWQLVALMGLSQAGYLSTKIDLGARRDHPPEASVSPQAAVTERRESGSAEHADTEPTK